MLSLQSRNFEAGASKSQYIIRMQIPPKKLNKGLSDIIITIVIIAINIHIALFFEVTQSAVLHVDMK